jgi:hypothetical protein
MICLLRDKRWQNCSLWYKFSKTSPSIIWNLNSPSRIWVLLFTCIIETEYFDLIIRQTSYWLHNMNYWAKTFKKVIMCGYQYRKHSRSICSLINRSISIKNYFLYERIPLQLRYLTAWKYSLWGFHRSNITIVDDRADVDYIAS